jgi:hypothetical protein
VQAHWLLAPPKGTDSAMSIEGGSVRLTTREEDISLRRRLDIAGLRGDRVRISARVRTDSPAAAATLTLFQNGLTPDYSDVVTARSTATGSWQTIQAVADVDPASMEAEIAVVVHGQGSAWFDDITVEDLGRSPPPKMATLSAAQIGNLVALARAATLVRYRHPSDQVAELDWNAFLPEATWRILQASGPASLIAALRDIFGPIAPAIEFDTQRTDPSLAPPRGAGSHLTRWRHLGFAAGSDPPYSSWREGRDADLGELQLTLPTMNPDVAHCKQARLIATGRSTGKGHASMFVTFERSGTEHKRAEASLNADIHEVGINVEAPGDAYRVMLGLKISGQVSLELRSMSLACDNATPLRLDLEPTTWKKAGWEDLYTLRATICDSADCLAVARVPFDTSFVPSRDVIDAEIGNGIWLHMPLAIWSDGARTYPAPGVYAATRVLP